MFRRISCLRALILNPAVSGDIGGGELGGGNLKLGNHLEWRDRMKLGGKNKHKY